MKTAIPKPSKQSIIREARDYVMIAIGMILYGIGWTVFLLPNDITTGGVPGIASIVYWATGFPVQYTYFSINFFLLLLALKLLGLKFCIKTIFGVFTLTFFLSVIQKLTAGFGLLHDQPFMACVIGGIAYWLCLRMNLETSVSQIIGGSVVLITRILAVKYRITLPILKGDTEEHGS